MPSRWSSEPVSRPLGRRHPYVVPVAGDRPDREQRVARDRAADSRGVDHPQPLAHDGCPLLDGERHVFFVWALGTHLRVFGYTTGMILPETLVRFIDCRERPRPGRAIVVFSLAIAVLGAIAISSRRRRHGGRGSVSVRWALIILLDYLPTPFPTVEVDRPATRDHCAIRPERGALRSCRSDPRQLQRPRVLDHRALAYKISTAARSSQAASSPGCRRRSSRGTPPILDSTACSTCLAGRRPRDAPDRAEAAALLAKNGVAFVMLNRGSRRRAARIRRSGMPLTLIAQRGRTLTVCCPLMALDSALNLKQ